MSSKINAISTGVGGLATSADASGILEIQTNDTTAVTVDGSQNVGIGTSNPSQKLQITNSSSSGFAAIRLSTDSRSYDIGIGGSTSGFQQNNYYLYDVTAGQPRLAIDTSGNLQFNSGYGSIATAYACRAWVNFNGTGTVAIRASGNVSSITDNGTGDYTVNFTNAMPDVNYGFNLSIGGLGSSTSSNSVIQAKDWGTVPATTSLRIQSSLASNGSGWNATRACVAIFR